MEFVLLKKLAKLEGTELWMFIGAIVAVAALIAVLAVLNKKHVNAAPTVEKKGNKLTTRMLVQGALCIALAFVLSYIKLFSMPMGGSITLFSMLPIFVFAWMYGPAAGLLAGFAYSLLQVVQGGDVHPARQVLLVLMLGPLAVQQQKGVLQAVLRLGGQGLGTHGPGRSHQALVQAGVFLLHYPSNVPVSRHGPVPPSSVRPLSPQRPPAHAAAR